VSYHTILVPLEEQPADARPAIEAAFLIAQAGHGHVHGLMVQPDLEHPAIHALVATRMSARAARSNLDQLRASAAQEIARQAAELRQLFEEVAGRAGAVLQAAPGDLGRPSASFEQITAFEGQAVAAWGRLFDLIVLARRGARGGAHDTVQAALLETGRPVLLVPPQPMATIGRTVLVAWNGSPQAARALAGAMPFLASAAAVTIIAVSDAPPIRPAAEDLARMLAWHGITASHRQLPQAGKRVRDLLLLEAQAMGADLLVQGAYSHSRMRQIVFGGVTEHMLDHAELPVLMCG
jgi:nucleotide-binding universal stress UspA family protein